MPHLRSYCSLPWEIQGAEMWIVEAECAVAKQLELCSTSFPASALLTLPQAVFSQQGTRGHELHALCSGPDWDLISWRSGRKDDSQWGSQEHLCSIRSQFAGQEVAWSISWFCASVFNTFLPFREKTDLLTLVPFKRMLTIGHRRVPLLRLSSLHSLCPLASLYLCHKAKANCDAQGKHCSVCP